MNPPPVEAASTLSAILSFCVLRAESVQRKLLDSVALGVKGLAWHGRKGICDMALPSDNETLFSPFHGRGTPLSFLGDVTRDPVADVTRSKREALALPCHAFGKARHGKVKHGKARHGKAWQSKTRALVPGRKKNILFESCRVETPSLIQWIEDQCSISWRTNRRLIRCSMK